MITELTLKLSDSLEEEQIAARVIDQLGINWLHLPDNLYRGVNASQKKLEIIRRTGTDREVTLHNRMALRELKKMERDYEDVTIEDALFATDPNYVWLNGERDLDESVMWARKGKNKPTILVFRGEIRLNQPRDLYKDYYKFNKPALSYLMAIIALDQSK